MASAIGDVRGGQTLSVAALADRSASVLERLRSDAQTARAGERREPTFPIGKAADLVGRTTAAIRDAESDGRLVPPPRGQNNSRVGYTLGQQIGRAAWRGREWPYV